jgi:hypothetical protein
MKNLIVDQIKELHRIKSDAKVHPSEPNEIEVSAIIAKKVKQEMDALIEAGTVKVTGTTVNRIRILSVE